MPNVEESIGQQNSLKSSLAAGVGVISSEQVITFTQYRRVVLPFDGYVFWLINNIGVSTPTLTVKGSLHYATTNQQNEDESFSVNRIVFTSEDIINDLNDIDDGLMWLGEFQGLKFAFSSRSSFYQQSGLYHYHGDAVYPTLETQIIDDVAVFDQMSVVVSNSLPIWLSLNSLIPVFPSFALPDNLRPPYAAIHISAEGTEPLQGVPWIDSVSSHWQLASDQVRITIYGLRNVDALDYLDYILNFMRTDDSMGLMSHPIVRDDKRTQTEINALAQKKIITLKVSYYQNTVRTIAQKLILSCIPTFTVANP